MELPSTMVITPVVVVSPVPVLPTVVPVIPTDKEGVQPLFFMPTLGELKLLTSKVLH